VIAVKASLLGDKASLKEHFGTLPGVESVQLISKPYRLCAKAFATNNKVVVSRKIGGKVVQVTFNGKEIITMAGPCSVESREQMDETAALLVSLGVKVLRGGAYKPRTAPGEFEGLQELGLQILAEMREKYGLLIITELLDVDTADMVAEFTDIIQIGTRNMQNFTLLKRAGKCNKPVLLKRGMSATYDEWLCAADYIIQEQKVPQVILCERGIRTFVTSTRNTFDVSAIPYLQNETWLPVVADASHATGYSELVASVTWAAIAAGAQGIMVEVHPEPSKALTDGRQSLNFQQFTDLYLQGKKFAEVSGKILV
jgi:3-deoxy-7-phosphoheptulonate synthase